MAGFVATASTEIAASPDQVWDTLTDPEEMGRSMHASTVTTTWEVGSPITWEGEHDGKPYQDKGEVLVFDQPRELSVTHYSPMMGKPDEPESYHTLVYTLTASDEGTRLELTQDGNDSEEQAEQFGKNWQGMLDGLRDQVQS